ncbi:MAG TPA: hypothetical protein VFU86_01585 [Terriglobales bacterium]|nr:hypothetical protein [Terriglobales bacterium]
MQANRILIAVLLAVAATTVRAQVVSPFEMQDPEMRRLQQKHLEDLKSIGSDLKDHKFPYAFYFSERLDIDEAVQQQIDQRSIRFENYNGEVALEITGNYYASYSAERLDPDRRLRQTYVDVVLPILQTAVPHFEAQQEVAEFAIEISHHVRKKVMGVDTEYAENVVVVVPRELAAKLIKASDLQVQQQLMVDAEVYFNSAPTVLWLAGEKPARDQSRDTVATSRKQAPTKVRRERKSDVEGGAPDDVPQMRLPVPVFQTAVRDAPPELREAPLHDSSPDALKALQESHKEDVDKLLQDLNSTAHFVPYAPPAFIPFKMGAYLQLSMTTDLDVESSGSQYKEAALAFDRHISHLLRPALAHLKDASNFDGFDFSTTVKIAGDKANTHTQAVEFILPFAALRCYANFECTGQQLLNRGFVLINGERVGLELQSAEATRSDH